MKIFGKRHKKKRLNRSAAGNIIIFAFLGIVAFFMVLPMLFTIGNAFKPLDELYLFPPKVFPGKPTMDNFSDLFVLMESSWVPFSRYILNTLIITVGGVTGHIILASAAAYPLAKNDFPGRNLLFGVVVLSLMFSTKVTEIPNFMIITALGINNTYLAVILPACASSLGLYLMKQFMEQIPTSLLECARLEGASEYKIFRTIVMPNVKPAWLTLMILMFQNLWGAVGAGFNTLRSEQLKPLNSALNSIAAGGTARAGVAGAVGFILIVVPVGLFIINQSQMIETMTTSGIKE